METTRQLSSHIGTLSADIQQEINHLLGVIEQRIRISREDYAQFKADEKLLRQLCDRMERQIDVAYMAQSIPHVAQPDLTCAWCWVKICPDVPFPSKQTSGICADHRAWCQSQVQMHKKENA